MNYPPIKLDFIRALTDDTGILQHAKFGTPRRKDGYTTDDNARALIAITKYSQTISNGENVERLLSTYLSFLLLMQKNDGKMHNLLGYDQRFIDDEGSEDCMGRTLWSCGCVVESMLSPDKRLMAKEIFDKLLPWAVNFNSPRAVAYSLIGLVKYQNAFTEDPNPTKRIRILVRRLLDDYKSCRSRSWHWFEPYLTYCNGRLPQALLEVYQLIPIKKCIKIALESLNFLIKVQKINDLFVPIGNQGWYKKDGSRSIYDQQSVEAAAMTEATLLAYRTTTETHYKNAANSIFSWFLGENTLKAAVYNSEVGGCYDGITSEGLNLNMGAEAIVCYLSARLELESQINHSSLRISIHQLLKR